MVDISRLPAPQLNYWEWETLAACRGMDSSVFFHPAAERDDARRKRIADAKKICWRRPALVACREHALRVRERYGIWGGLSEDERATASVRTLTRP